MLNPGDLMVLYSDGVTEAANHAEDFFGDERLAATLTRVAGADEQTAVSALANDVKAFADGYRQSDDITIVAVRRNP
jgi:sigma-B regulation protein RsbU (phosphoserine phosphatase)